MRRSTDRGSVGRRTALRLLAGAAGSLALLSSRGAAEARGPDPIQAIVRSSDGAARIAARLEICCGAPERVEEIFAAELAALRRQAAAAGTLRQLAANVRRLVSADFAAGRVFMLDGWMLARTEVALCYEAAARGGRPRA